MVGVKYIASVSFGKDSLAMLLRLLEGKYPLDAVVFYDTGMEFKAIYNIRDNVRHILSDNMIEYVELRPDKPFLYSMLEQEIKYRSKDGYHYGYGWCGGACRWHTSMKVRSISKYKKSLNDDVIDYVGIAFDEQHRFEKEKRNDKRLPLVEFQMTEMDCLLYCRKMGFNWIENGVDLYDILDRVSCWCCRNKNLKELRNIYNLLPEYWEKLKELQRKIQDPIKGSGNSIFDLQRRFEIEKQFIASGKSLHTREFYNAIKMVV